MLDIWLKAQPSRKIMLNLWDKLQYLFQIPSIKWNPFSSALQGHHYMDAKVRIESLNSILTHSPTVDLHFIFEKWISKNGFRKMDFCLFWIWIFQAAQEIEIKFEKDQKRSSFIFLNQCFKNQVQGVIKIRMISSLQYFPFFYSCCSI